MAGLKLIVGIIAVIIIAAVLVFSILGNPFPGFDVLSLLGTGAGSGPVGKEALNVILTENPALDANLSDYMKTKLNKIIEEENPNMSKEEVQKLIEGSTKPIDEEEWNRATEELSRRLAENPTGEVSDEFEITIGGRIYTQKDFAEMSEEELKALKESMTPEERAFIESQPGGGQK